jgi:hypothetical protein
MGTIKRYVMYRLNQETLQKVKDNPLVIGQLAATFKKGTQSVERWVRENHIMLTTWAAMEIISKQLGTAKSDCLEVDDSVKMEVTNHQ